MERDRLGVALANHGELARTMGERHERWASLDRRVAIIDGRLAAALILHIAVDLA
jgi:hypothetical protein